MTFDDLNATPIEAYCVSCREKRDMDGPQAVWTSQGRPGTRGTCPICGSTMFRMGRTHLHEGMTAPAPVEVVPKHAKGQRAAYIAASVTDAEIATQLGNDLKAIGVPIWVDDGSAADTVKWSGGVHPALEQCTHLIMVLSGFTAKTNSVRQAWEFFLSQRKPIIIVQAESDVEPPDRLRSRPRFDVTSDYKSAFRGVVEWLSR